MSDDTDRADLTRRRLLAVAGASALAGCGSLDSLGSDERTIRAYDLPDVDAESVPDPVVAPAIPVGIARSHLSAVRDRTTALLADLPTPLGPDEIPNGHVRQRLTDAAGDATDGLDGARTARTDLLALQSLRDAREHARYAVEGWAVAAHGQSAAPLRSAYEETVAEARAFRADYEYVGTDPVRAALVHARVEGLLDRLTDDERPRVRGEGELLTVAEWGETAESAQARLADARHLHEQFAAALPGDAGTVADTLRGAAASLFAEVRSRQSDLPPEPTAEDWGPAERVVHYLRQEADDGPVRVADTPGPASAVVDLTDRLAQFGALDRVVDRVDAGEIDSVESAAELRALRQTAYDAFETALAESPAPELARSVVSTASWRVTGADRELSRVRGDLRPDRLDDVVTDYVVATARARATPDACQRTLDALDAA